MASREEVHLWLGLTSVPPVGLHGAARHRLTRRYLRIPPEGHAFDRALVAAYPRHRETRLMALLRYQRLDDDFWRKIYALMVQGGPIVGSSLVRAVALLTDRDAAYDEAVRQYAYWDRHAPHPEQK